MLPWSEERTLLKEAAMSRTVAVKSEAFDMIRKLIETKRKTAKKLMDEADELQEVIPPANDPRQVEVFKEPVKGK